MGNKDTKLKIIIDAQDNTKGALKSVNTQLGQTESSTRNVMAGFRTMAIATTAAATAIGGFGFMAIKAAAQAEQSKISFTTMLGSAEKAGAFLQELTNFAKTTPFELQGLKEASTRLLAYGLASEEVLPTLKTLGDISAGVGMEKLPFLITALGQVRAKTILSGEELKQFMETGVPLVGELARVTGLSTAQITDQTKDLGITYEQVRTALSNLSSEGGKFNNLMDAQSKSLSGMISNLKDAWNIFLTNEGAKLLDWAKFFVAIAVDIVANKLPAWINAISNLRSTIAGFLNELDTKTGLVTMFKDAWAAIALVWQYNLKPALDELWAALQPYKPFLEAMVQVFGTMLVIAIGALITILGSLAIILMEVLTQLTKVSTFLLNTFGSAWDFIVEKISKVIDTIDKLIGWFKKGQDAASSFYSKTASVFGASSKTKSVNDAIISPDGDIITTHPDDYLIATKNPSSLLGGGGVNIYITGNTLLDRDAATKMGDLIMGKLRLSNQM